MENTEQNARTYVEVNSPYEGIDKEVIIRLLLDFANQQLRIKVDKYGKELSDSIESAIAIEFEGGVYLQRLEPKTATGTQLVAHERLIIHQYEFIKSLLKKVERFKKLFPLLEEEKTSRERIRKLYAEKIHESELAQTEIKSLLEKQESDKEENNSLIESIRELEDDLTNSIASRDEHKEYFYREREKTEQLQAELTQAKRI